MKDNEIYGMDLEPSLDELAEIEASAQAEIAAEGKQFIGVVNFDADSIADAAFMETAFERLSRDSLAARDGE